MQVLTTCQYCGKEFLVLKKELTRGNGRFCSRKCSAAFGNVIRNKAWKKILSSSQGKTLEISEDFGHYIAGLVDGEGCFAAYSVQRLKDNINRIVPFFDCYSLRARKRKDFAIYKEIAERIKTKSHLTKEGIAEIFALRAEINERGISLRKNVSKEGR